MKKICISRLLAVICMMAAWYMVAGDRDRFIELGSKLIWNFDKSYYSDIGIWFYNDDRLENYVVSPMQETTCDYEVEQLCAFKEKLDKAGIELLYVNKPTKYTDDSIFRELGTETFCNSNADKLLKRLEESGITCLDLREEMEKDGLDVYSMFYYTDHHWTVPAGKWGAEKIAEKLNESYGFNIDLSIYADNNYDFKTTKEGFLGEQGSKLRGSEIKSDDYTLVTPKFPTNYSIAGTECDFMCFIKSPTFCNHYNYEAPSCVNNNIEKGNVYMLGDSFDMVTEPFLSLGLHTTYFINRRDKGCMDYDVYNNNIKGKEIDVVIVCYAEIMIGAHDNPISSNSSIFNMV